MSGGNIPRLEKQLIGMVTTLYDIKGHILFILMTERRVILLNDETFFCPQQNCLHTVLVSSAEHKRRTNRILNRLFKEFITSVCLSTELFLGTALEAIIKLFFVIFMIHRFIYYTGFILLWSCCWKQPHVAPSKVEDSLKK